MHGKKFTRAAGGVGLGLATGAVGLAAQIADGDLLDNPSKAFGQTAAAAGVGYLAGKNITGRGIQGLINGTETFKEGAYGLEAYNNMKFDKQFYASDGYRMMSEDSALVSMYGGQEGLQLATQMFLDNKITDATVIREALQNTVSADEYNVCKKAGIESPKKIKELKGKGYSANGIAAMKVLAANAPKTLEDFKAMMVGRKFDGEIVDSNKAEDIFKQLVDFF